MKKTLFFVLFCQINIIFGQQSDVKNTSEDSDLISSIMQLSHDQLFDTAKYYFNNNSFDTAIICYNIIINIFPKNADTIQQKKMADAYNRLASIYGSLSDYRIAYDYFIKALLICEKYNLQSYKSRTYANIGVLYSYINQYEMSKQYHLKALEFSTDSMNMVLILNNLGHAEIYCGKMDSAYYYINKAIQISKRHNDRNMFNMINSLATIYKYDKQYDSAMYYLRLSLDQSIKNNSILGEIANLTDLGKLYFELNKIDSAIYYIDLSNKIASENKYLNFLADNYLVLSEIEMSRGKYKNALNHHITYTNLKDSIYNGDVYGSINLLQRQYEVSKTNHQIEEYIISQQIKDNTIHYQKIIQRNTSTALVALIIVLGVVLLQNNKLRKAYKVLVDKNVEIVEMIGTSPSPSEIDTSSTPSEGGETDNYPSLQSDDFEILNSKPEILNSDVPETPNLQPETVTDSSPLTSHPAPLTSDIEGTDEEKEEKAPKKPLLSDDVAKELLDKIMDYMKNHTEIYHFDFSMDILAESIDSNYSYVSYVINNVLKKNFRSFLNSYRIREAQRLFSESKTAKYTIEFIAHSVGFHSRNSFRDVFKEVTGVTPAFYLKSLLETESN